MKLNVRYFTAGAVVGGIATTIAHNPKPFIDVCGAIFNNKIAKGAGLGLVSGTVVSGVLVLRDRLSPHQGGTQASMGAAFTKAFIQLLGPPVVGTLGGALIGGVLALSRHITVQIK